MKLILVDRQSDGQTRCATTIFRLLTDASKSLTITEMRHMHLSNIITARSSFKCFHGFVLHSLHSIRSLHFFQAEDQIYKILSHLYLHGLRKRLHIQVNEIKESLSSKHFCHYSHTNRNDDVNKNQQPNKQKTLTQCYCNVGPTSATLAQHYINISSLLGSRWFDLIHCWVSI